MKSARASRDATFTVTKKAKAATILDLDACRVPLNARKAPTPITRPAYKIPIARWPPRRAPNTVSATETTRSGPTKYLKSLSETR
jgi:hypothetical protein